MHFGFMITILGVRGLDSSVNIMRFINKNMLVIEVNVDFSLINGFMCKYVHAAPQMLCCFQMFFFFSDSFESRSAVQILYAIITACMKNKL